jgi:AraC-like DNA-binding protein
VKAICRFIEQHLDEPVTLDRLGKEFHQSPFHLQRRFKAVLGITPREYADSCRLRLLKRNLQAGDSVTRAMYDAGYGSSSRLYERTASQLGMTPDKYRRGAIAATIRYTCAESPLGRMLIAATERGICSIQFARTDGELIEGLKREFPFAGRKSDDGGLKSWASALLKHMRFPAPCLDVFAENSLRRHALLQRSRQGDWPAYCRPRGSSRLRHQSSGRRDSLPSRGSRRWQHGWIPVGHRAKENSARNGASLVVQASIQ